MFILGSRTIEWNGDGLCHYFTKLDEEGNEIFSVEFLIEAFYSSGNETFMLTLPVYEETSQNDMEKDMLSQAYFAEDDDLYYFKVTEEQYNQLLEKYFETAEAAYQYTKQKTYTYEELFLK